MDSQWREYASCRSPFDPCPPKRKAFIVSPNNFLKYQPKGLRQFTPREALSRGTLWPDLFSPYLK